MCFLNYLPIDGKMTDRRVKSVEKLKRVKKPTFGSDTQDKTLRLMITESSLLNKMRGILKPVYFNSPLAKNLCSGIYDFFDKYRCAPNFEQLDGILSTLIEKRIISEDEIDIYVTYLDRLINDVKVDNITRAYLLDNAKTYARGQILAIVTKACNKALKENKPASDVISYISEALEEYSSVGQQSNLVTLEKAIDTYSSVNDIVTCMNVGPIDKQLGGGFQRGLFYVILGYTEGGKTWMMIHLGKLAARLGMLVVHIVVELSNSIVVKRYKQSMSYHRVGDLLANHKYIKEIVRKSMVNRTNIILVDEEEKSKPIDSLLTIRDQVVKEYGKAPDLWLIDSAEDYLPPGNKKHKDEYSAEGATFTYLKDFAKMNTCVITTAQAMKQSEKILWLGASHCSGSALKMRKAMGAISLNATPQEKELGIYRVHLFKHTEGERGAKAWVRRNYTRGQAVIESGSMRIVEKDGRVMDYKDWLQTQERPEET